MSLRVRAVAAAGALAIVAACSDSSVPTAPTGTTPAPSLSRAPWDDGAAQFPGRRVHELRGSPGQAKASRRGGGGTGISYHGGPVLQAGTKVVAVYWSSATIYSGGPVPGTKGAGSADGSLVGWFLRSLGGSPYFNINSTYTDGSGRAITNAVSYVGFWANATSAPSGTQKVTDAQMLSMLQGGFASGAISYDANTLYLIMTAGKVNLGGGFGTQYCAYHWYGSVTVNGKSVRVLYAAMPYDAAYPSACTAGVAPANGDAGADAEVNTLGHEIEETTTDMNGTAWYDNQGNENADKCAWNFGSAFTTAAGGVANMTLGGKPFLVQQNWVNSGSGGCLQHWP